MIRYAILCVRTATGWQLRAPVSNLTSEENATADKLARTVAQVVGKRRQIVSINSLDVASEAESDAWPRLFVDRQMNYVACALASNERTHADDALVFGFLLAYVQACRDHGVVDEVMDMPTAPILMDSDLRCLVNGYNVPNDGPRFVQRKSITRIELASARRIHYTGLISADDDDFETMPLRMASSDVDTEALADAGGLTLSEMIRANVARLQPSRGGSFQAMPLDMPERSWYPLILGCACLFGVLCILGIILIILGTWFVL